MNRKSKLLPFALGAAGATAVFLLMGAAPKEDASAASPPVANKIVHYQLLGAESNLQLGMAVEATLDQGWVLFGTPVITDGRFYQGMVKRVSE